MKYLKQFNESDKSEYYIKYDPGHLHSKDLCIMSEGNIKYFESIIKIFHFSVHKRMLTFYYKLSNSGINIPIGYIYEIPDEYFIVYFIKSKSYYKCDQLDGVKELLVDKRIIEA